MNKLIEYVECKAVNFTNKNMNNDEMHDLIIDSIIFYHMIIKE